ASAETAAEAAASAEATSAEVASTEATTEVASAEASSEAAVEAASEAATSREARAALDGVDGLLHQERIDALDRLHEDRRGGLLRGVVEFLDDPLDVLEQRFGACHDDAVGAVIDTDRQQVRRRAGAVGLRRAGEAAEEAGAAAQRRTLDRRSSLILVHVPDD